MNQSSVIDANLPLDELTHRTSDRFQQKFGRPPRWIAAAPGRVNLIGEHTDYNEGFVLPMAIQRYTVVAVDRAANGDRSPTETRVQVHSQTVGETDSFVITAKGIDRGSGWANYVRGVVAGCVNIGMSPGPLDVLVDSTVPLGGGLSSSAAIEVAVATSLEAVTGQTLEPTQKALLCQKAEHEYAGVPCGIMDQFMSVMGQRDHLMLLDCRSTNVDMVPLTSPDVAVLIVNSNVKHELSGGEYAQRRSQCEAAARALGIASLRDATLSKLESSRDALDEVQYLRARHVISENDRTQEAADRFRAGDWRRVGELMYASHESLRDDYQVSCKELDQLVELARGLGESGGVFGSRMTGGGFGGCTVSLVKTDAIESAARAIHAGYRRESGIEPTVFVSRPAQGARIMRGAAHPN